MSFSDPGAWSKPLSVAGPLLSAFSAGFIVSASLITIPTIIDSGTPTAMLKSWHGFFERAKVRGPPIGVAAVAAHLANAYMHRGDPEQSSYYFVAAAISQLSIIPFSQTFLRSTNAQLNKMSEGTAPAAGIVNALNTWTTLNTWRAFFPAAAVLLSVMAL